MLETDIETRLKPPSASGAQQGSSLFTHFEDVQVAAMYFGFYYILKINRIMPFCNLFIERSS